MRSPSYRTAPIALILVLFFALSAIDAAPLDPTEIPGDTKWLLHFDMEKARSWELMQKWQSEMENKTWYQDKVEEMVETYG